MSTSGKSQRSLKILVTPLNGHGHINACHGLCEELRDRGHRVIFVVDKDFQGKLSKHGFEEAFINPKHEDGGEEEGEFWPNFIRRHARDYAEPPINQIKAVICEAFTLMFETQVQLQEEYENLINTLKPDVIIHDGYVGFPAIIASKVPWVWLFSAAPHAMLHDPRIPPIYSGLPLNGDKSEWKRHLDKVTKDLEPLHTRANEYMAKYGLEPLPPGRLHPLSPYLNLFMQPQELRYDELNDLPENIVAVDCFVRTLPDVKFELPEKLKNKPGKLVLFSMGSFCCANLPLMKRLLAIMAKSPHRFLVAKGPLEYDLPGENMWGDKFLPQTAIIPMVDLVITHGGNNTLTEAFYFGKKLLVLPAFCDQWDNAQRVTETGLGLRANPYHCEEKELLQAIDKLVMDEQLTKRMEQIGKRIRATKDKQKVADMIENLKQA